MKFCNTTLGDISVNNKGNYGIAVPAVSYNHDLYRYLRITDILDDGTVSNSNIVSVDDKDASKYLLRENDIVFARTGASTGRNYFYNSLDGELVYAGYLIKFTINEKVVNPIFIKYYCRSSKYWSWVASFNSGSTRGNINAQVYSSMPIKLPSREQQDFLAEVLSTIDSKIRINKKINDNLEEQAKTIFYEWMHNFSQNTCSNMISSEFGKIPQEFSLNFVGKLPITITDYVANGSFASLKENVKLYQNPNFAYFIRNTDLKSDKFNVYVDKHSYEFLDKSKLFGNEIIISNVGDVGSVFLCPKLDKPMTLGNNIIMIRPRNTELTYYLYMWFKWFYGQELIQRIKSGSVQAKFNKTDFKSLPIYLPPQSLLRQFNSIINPMFERIKTSNAESNNLVSIRNFLLPKLMSGEIDVSNIKI